ncbi:MAG TPA: hypothetical protein VHL98_06995 [Microvirga sp.]|jgi:hypothetical protein|nr:hypothetical protein [Microvirga sp.]
MPDILRAAVAAALLAAFAAPASAQHGPPVERRVVAAVIRDADRTCREEGGTGIAAAPEAIERRDLDGDGRTDMVINHRDIVCAGAASVFCGTAGCRHVILLARAGGGFRRILDGRILAYAVEGRRLTVRLHGGHCDRGGLEECRRRFPLDGRRIALP